MNGISDFEGFMKEMVQPGDRCSGSPEECLRQTAIATLKKERTSSYFYFTLLLFSSPQNLDYSLLQCGYSAVIKNPLLGFDTIPPLCAGVVESVKVECRNVTSILLHPKVSKDNKMCRVKTGRKKSGIVQRQ